MSSLVNKGVGAGFTFDIDGDDGEPKLRIMPAFQPGDAAMDYMGDLDTSTIGTGPLSYERLAQESQLLFNEDTFLATNTGKAVSADLVHEALNFNNNSRHINFPGTASNYLSVPDAAPLDITTSISITVRMSTIWDNKIRNQRIVAKSGTGRGYELFIGYDSQHAKLGFGRDGSNLVMSSVGIPVTNERNAWIRATYNSATSTVLFYWAPDAVSEPGVWTALGSARTLTGAIVANNDTLKIGTYNGSGDMFVGRLYNVIIRNADTGGSVVLNIDVPTDCVSMTQDVSTTFTATSGQTVTLTKSGTPPNTCRMVFANSTVRTDGHRWGFSTNTNITELTTTPNTLQVYWVKATLGTMPTQMTSNREIVPIIGVGDPYQPNSWFLFFDVFGNELKLNIHTSTVSLADFYSINFGPTIGTSGDAVFGIALVEAVGGYVNAWIFKYTETGGYTYQALNSDPSSFGVFSDDLIIGTTNKLQLWSGVTGFQIDGAGMYAWPNFYLENDGIGWHNSDAPIRDMIERYLKVVPLEMDPPYEVGQFWQATADGTGDFASSAIKEGDVFAVRTVSPVTFQQIKLDHPYKRKALFNSRYTSWLSDTPLHVDDTDDFFIWVVASGERNNEYSETDYLMVGYDSTESNWMAIEAGRDPDDDDAYVYAEIMDNGGGGGWNRHPTDDMVAPFHTLWDRGFSEPTFFGMGINRTSGEWDMWFYDASHGMTHVPSRGDYDPPTDDIDMDGFWIFGNEDEYGAAAHLWYAGGWRAGIGVIPTEDEMIQMWQRAVYGYAS